MFDVTTAKNFIDGIVLILPDFTHPTFEWGKGRTASAARAALSPEGTEIPVPLIAVFLPICKDGVKDIMEMIETKSGRDSTKSHPCYRLYAETEQQVVSDALRVGHVVWRGTSVDILNAGEKNGGFGAEAVILGLSNHEQCQPVDGILHVKLGCCERVQKVQMKELRPTFRRERDKTAGRGSRAGYVTANYTRWTVSGDDTEA